MYVLNKQINYTNFRVGDYKLLYGEQHGLTDITKKLQLFDIKSEYNFKE